MHNVLNLSEYVVQRAEFKGNPITNLKLQKTLYYLQGYSLREFDSPAFDSDIQKWMYGPVAVFSYFAYSSYNEVPLESGRFYIAALSKKESNLYNKIIDACFDIPAKRLVQMTLNKFPCACSKLYENITLQVMKNYFQENNPLGIEYGGQNGTEID